MVAEDMERISIIVSWDDKLKITLFFEGVMIILIVAVKS